MFVTLVPFLLAANISTNVGDWKYGPEVIYDAKLDNVVHPLEEFKTIFEGNVTVKFRCRPKTQVVLSCRIYEPRISYTIINGTSRGKIEVEEISELDMKHHSGPFELYFDQNGLKEIAVPSSLDSILDIWLDLAKLLNYGGVIATMSRTTFDINENPATGQCKAHYTQLWNRLINDDDDDTERNYNILIMRSIIVPEEVRMGFERSSYLHKCPYRYDYYAPGPRVIGQVLNDRKDMPEVFFESELKSLKSRIAMTHRTFFSESEECMFIEAKGNLGSVYFSPVERKKTMSINLVDIVPAKGRLDKISDPTRIRVYSIERRDGTNSSE